MDYSTPGLPVLHHLPEFTQTHVHEVGDTTQPSHPLSSPSPPTFNLSQHQGLFKWVSSLHQVAKILEFQLQHESFQWTPRCYHMINIINTAVCCIWKLLKEWILRVLITKKKNFFSNFSNFASFWDDGCSLNLLWLSAHNVYKSNHYVVRLKHIAVYVNYRPSPVTQLLRICLQHRRHTGDAGLIPGSGRSPGGGNGKPRQQSCLENPTFRGPW